jgi:hypothetical protein
MASALVTADVVLDSQSGIPIPVYNAFIKGPARVQRLFEEAAFMPNAGFRRGQLRDLTGRAALHEDAVARAPAPADVADDSDAEPESAVDEEQDSSDDDIFKMDDVPSRVRKGPHIPSLTLDARHESSGTAAASLSDEDEDDALAFPLSHFLPAQPARSTQPMAPRLDPVRCEPTAPELAVAAGATARTEEDDDLIFAMSPVAQAPRAHTGADDLGTLEHLEFAPAITRARDVTQAALFALPPAPTLVQTPAQRSSSLEQIADRSILGYMRAMVPAASVKSVRVMV